MLEPKTEMINGRDFVLTKFPAIVGREILAKYPLSAMPKLGDYAVNEETMLKLMGFVGVEIEGREKPQMLTTRALVDNHCGDWETLVRVEFAMLEYNCSFFRDGRASGFFEVIARKAQAWITQTLTTSLAQSSPTGKPPSTS